MPEIREIKTTVDGRKQVFTTEELLFSKRVVIVCFRLTNDRLVSGFRLLAGGYTLGFFWAARNYTLYRFCRPDGEVIAHRFDVIALPRIRPGEVAYRDLVVDVWVAPDGRYFAEDEDELERYVAEGRVTARDLVTVSRTRHLLLTHHQRIIDEARTLTDHLQGIAVSP